MKVCLECERPVRAQGVTIEDAPGTILLHGRGLCRKCHDGLKSEGVLDKLYPATTSDDGRVIRRIVIARDRTEPCQDCGRDMRPPATTLEEWPGTVSRRGSRCATCASHSATPKPVMPTAADVRKMRQDLKDWFYSRGRDWRLSGIPA